MTAESKVRVNLVDVMSVLNVGHFAHANLSIPDAGGGHFPTGGMYKLLELFRRVKLGGLQDLWIFCFDRHSFRKELSLSLGFEYKANRKGGASKHALYVQSDELYYWLDKIGFNVMAVEGLEADDLIASYVELFRPNDFIFTNIISTDRDLAVHLHEGSYLMSPNSKIADVSISNYHNTVGVRGEVVEYNTVMLYKAICGDTSDTIPSACYDSYAVYRRLINHLNEANIDLSQLNTAETVGAVIETYLTGDVKQKALNNLQVIKPHYIPVETLPLKEQVIDYDVMREFCSIFSMGNLARKFGVAMDTFHENTYNYRIGLQDKLAEKMSSSYDGESTNSSSDEDGELPSIRERIDAINSNTEFTPHPSIKVDNNNDNESLQSASQDGKISSNIDVVD